MSETLIFNATLALEAGGVHLLELGVPFSDPIADGPVIQEAAVRALRGRKHMKQVLEIVRALREKTDILSYYNPILAVSTALDFFRNSTANANCGLAPVLALSSSNLLAPASLALTGWLTAVDPAAATPHVCFYTLSRSAPEALGTWSRSLPDCSPFGLSNERHLASSQEARLSPAASLERSLFDFFKEASEAGVDGLLIVDCPFEESLAAQQKCAEHQLAFIHVVTPSTSMERLPLINKHAQGFLYYACRKGTTGVRSGLPDDFSQKITAIKAATSLPLVVGFGISDQATVQQVLAAADGVVVGSLFVKALADGADSKKLTALAKTIFAL